LSTRQLRRGGEGEGEARGCGRAGGGSRVPKAPVSSGLLPVVRVGRFNSQSGYDGDLGVRLQHRRHATYAHDGSPPSLPPAMPAPAGHLGTIETSERLRAMHCARISRSKAPNTLKGSSRKHAGMTDGGQAETRTSDRLQVKVPDRDHRLLGRSQGLDDSLDAGVPSLGPARPLPALAKEAAQRDATAEPG